MVAAESECASCNHIEVFDIYRKICSTCKCPPENHDIQAESSIQHKIGKLFGQDHEDQYGQFYTLDTSELVGNHKGGDKLRAAEYKKISDAGGDEKDQITFEWIPSNTPKSLVLKYISALPLENQPIRGTVGATERTKQLQHQLPTHDVVSYQEYSDTFSSF